MLSCLKASHARTTIIPTDVSVDNHDDEEDAHLESDSDGAGDAPLEACEKGAMLYFMDS